MENMIAIGKVSSRKSSKLKQVQLPWSVFAQRLLKVERTQESQAEFFKLTHEEQTEIKDKGGYLAGISNDGTRAQAAILSRSCAVLDMDYGEEGVLELLKECHKFECVIHSTHKHTPDKPRLRIIFPLKEPISAELYKPLVQTLMLQFGSQYFDTTCDQANRVMFWGSASRDAEIVSLWLHGPLLDAQEFLNTYASPSVQALTFADTATSSVQDNTSSASVQAAEKIDNVASVQANTMAAVPANTPAPVCAPASVNAPNKTVAVPTNKQDADIKQQAKNKLLQADPYKKTGIIGAFIRTHSPAQAIQEFANGLYRPTTCANRYDYIPGSGSMGLVIYENAFLYSYHATDPLRGKLYNTFDFVKALKFGKGKEAFQKMLNFCYNDPKTSAQFNIEKAQGGAPMTTVTPDRQNEANSDDLDWQLNLARNKDNSLKPTITNICCILRHDGHLQGLALNEYTGAIVKRAPLPWHDYGEEFMEGDYAACRCYLSEKYALECNPSRLDAAISQVASERAFNPLKERLHALPPWDGQDHVTSIFVDYLGAANTVYTRAVARCFVLGLLQRILHPGYKHDTMLVLVGEQGNGKSKFWDSWFPEYYTEDFSFASLDKGKEGSEKLQQCCIVHVGELCGMTASRTQSIKNFLSLRSDLYRPAYGKKDHKYPRQCVFVGSTNQMEGFLVDTTGNRRFHPLPVDATKATKKVDAIAPDIDQALAQGMYLLEQGALSYLTLEEEEFAKAMQKRYMVKDDDLVDTLRNYTNILWPSTYNTMSLPVRQDYVRRHLDGTYPDLQIDQLALRNDFCYPAIFEEFIATYFRDNKYQKEDIARAMQHLQGFTHKRKSVPHYGQMRCFVRTQAS